MWVVSIANRNVVRHLYGRTWTLFVKVRVRTHHGLVLVRVSTWISIVFVVGRKVNDLVRVGRE